MSHFALCLFLCIGVPACAITRASGATPSQFLLVSGLSGASETCVVAGAGDVGAIELEFEPCEDAVASGDGRELWSFRADGVLASAATGQCVGVGEGASGGEEGLLVSACDDPRLATWEMQGNGQMSIRGKAGSHCLSASGAAPGLDNIGLTAAVHATSAIDALSHGAARSVDGSSSSYWASVLGSEPVAITADFGEPRKLVYADIDWEFPPQAFALSVSPDGSTWQEVFSTDINSMPRARIPIGDVYATKARITMTKADPVLGKSHGRAFVGIRSMGFFARGLRPSLTSCAEAKGASDARGTFFLVHAGAPMIASHELESELPALEAATSSLAATLSELNHALGTADCGASLAFPSRRGASHGSVASFGKRTKRGDIDDESIAMLLAAAREAVIEARQVLKRKGALSP